MRTFTFNNQNSADFGIILELPHHMLIPPKRSERMEIPLRSGSYDLSTKPIYNDRTITCDCAYIGTSNEKLREDARNISWWLSQKGKLIFSDEPDKHYNAEVISEIPIEEQFKIGRFTLDFICEPFAYSGIKSHPLHTGVNTVPYGGTIETPCLIILKNSGNAVTKIQITTVKRG